MVHDYSDTGLQKQVSCGEIICIWKMVYKSLGLTLHPPQKKKISTPFVRCFILELSELGEGREGFTLRSFPVRAEGGLRMSQDAYPDGLVTVLLWWFLHTSSSGVRCTE